MLQVVKLVVVSVVWLEALEYILQSQMVGVDLDAVEYLLLDIYGILKMRHKWLNDRRLSNIGSGNNFA